MCELFSEFSESLTNSYENNNWKQRFSLGEQVLHEHFLIFFKPIFMYVCNHPWCVLVGVPETEERGAYHFKCA